AVDTSVAPASSFLGALGMPGLTAYVGLKAVADLQEGETVFISGAAGAVGSMAGQIARKLGATNVVGSAGTDDKVSWLTDDLGFDAAFNYRSEPVVKQLGAHAPVDVYFDNVGGDHLEAAIFHMADFGRLALCGSISSYDSTEAQPGPRNLMMAISKRLTLRGFIVSDHGALAAEFYRTVGPWLAAGEITSRETFADGLDQAVDAFLGLGTGANTGKMLIRL
ncbi:MAG: NADP-dependent oxidoreductase, partial [Nocardioides sp.]